MWGVAYSVATCKILIRAIVKVCAIVVAPVVSARRVAVLTLPPSIFNDLIYIIVLSQMDVPFLKEKKRQTQAFIFLLLKMTAHRVMIMNSGRIRAVWNSGMTSAPII